MHRSIRNALAVTLFVFSSAAVGQEEAVRLTRTYVFKPKSGHALKFEEAVKQHMKWAKEQNSKWSWDVFAITTGQRLGHYLLVSGNHTWEDFDENREFGRRAVARWQANVSQHVESVEGGIYRLLADHSRVPESVDPYPYAAVSFFYMRPTATPSFLQKLREITDAMKKQESAPPAFWYDLVNGGEAKLVWVRPFKKWADWPKGQAAFQAMTKDMGQSKVDAIIQGLGKDIAREESSIITLRPDLSFVP